MRTGIDITMISRFEDKLNDRTFLARIFTEKELTHIFLHKTIAGQAERMAGKFCAKEAVLKALGCGVSHGINFIDVEILPNSEGAPQAFLHNYAKKLCQDLGINEISVSISHDGDFAVANCVAI